MERSGEPEIAPRGDSGRVDVTIANGGVHHISFRVDDVATSLAFYRDLLGCCEIPRPDFGFPGAWLVAGHVELHLLEIPRSTELGSSAASATPFANHLAFAVDDLQSVRDNLERIGVACYMHADVSGQCWVQDPDGNVVEFIVRDR